MKISLREMRATNLSMTFVEQDESESIFDLAFENNFSESETKEFSVAFRLKMNVPDNGMRIELVYEAVFEASEVISEEFKSSPFTRINAPAIVYPYLRSFISNLTINSGFDPVILPTINFQALDKSRNIENVIEED